MSQQSGRLLTRVFAVDAEDEAAAALALSHARRRLALPGRLPVGWYYAPGGPPGETWAFADGSVEIRVNVALDRSPRDVGWVVLHEAFHVAYPRLPYAESEPLANQFAFEVMEEQHDAFRRLSWRRRSQRERGAYR